MKIDWSPLRHAIKHAENPRFWWRDDDAVAQTNALDQMLRLSETLRTPVQIAVIPGLLEPSLAPALDGTTARVLVHGWTHTNHAPDGEKNAEFRRSDTAAIDELSQGMNILATNFGGRLDPVFVPPWNRVSPALYTPLADAGYRAISTYGPVCKTEPLDCYNTHVDPIMWRGHRSLVDPETLIATAATQLTNEPDTPLGLLTHHLVHDPAIWAFTDQFIQEVSAAGAQPWTWRTEP